MALHGEIHVNAQPIAQWSAVRQQHRLVDEQLYLPIYTYQCEVVRYSDGKKVTFMLQHNYNEGAMALAAAVINNGSHLLDTLEVAK